MASVLEGMFTDPRSFRNERLDDMMALQARQAQMGGSYNDLLGQVAAQGNIMGMMGAEAAAGMFGMKTAEEAKAQQLSDMASNFDLNTSTGLASFAKQLNDMGMTKEAIQVMNERKSVLDRERRIAIEDEDRQLDAALREGKLRKGIPRIELRVRTDSKGNPLIGPNGQPLMERVEIPTYERWSEEEQRYIPVGKQSSETPSTSGLNVVGGWDTLLKSSSPSGKPDMATNMPAQGTGAHALKGKDAKSQGKMVEAYANYLRSLPAGAVPMEMDAWFKSQQ